MRLTELATPLKLLEAMAQGRLFAASSMLLKAEGRRFAEEVRNWQRSVNNDIEPFERLMRRQRK